MPPRKVAKAGEKRKIATVEIDWEADREAEDVPGLLRELGKKLKTDTDESEKWKSGFPKRDYKACPDHLNKVADKLAKQFDSRAELEKTNQKLLEEIAELKRTIADHEASVPKPPKDPTKKTKPGPIPHHLQTLIMNTTRATDQGHFRWESHVDLLVGNLLTHCFPLDHGFFVGAQQTFMTGTAADDEMIDIMNSWSLCVEPLDTTRTTYNDRASLADSTRELDSTEAPGSIGVPRSPTASSHEVGPMTSTPRPLKDAFFPEDELQGEFWDDLSVDSINFPAEPDLTNTSPHPNATISPSSSLSAVPIAAASITLQVPSSDVSVLNASPLPTVHGRPSSQSGPAQVWDNVNDLFPNRTAPNLAYAPPPPILISPPADPSSSSLAARLPLLQSPLKCFPLVHTRTRWCMMGLFQSLCPCPLALSLTCHSTRFPLSKDKCQRCPYLEKF
ncbi:hypothetical protein CPB85DRAFT_1000970 [Mucidula mucida]|nr:hypothetical protein CPB85DRAFT_1000970 [Mucidula mucida]